jgi:WD40 repeat protein
MVVACSLDTTFSVYDVSQTKQIHQVKAHDKEVNDISFANNPHIFATVSSDGTCKQFDLRNV